MDIKQQQITLARLKTHKDLNHPNILKIIEIFDNQSDFIYVVQENIDSTLKSKLSSKYQFSEVQFLSITKQICNAVKIFHDTQIYHLNTVPSNIYLLENVQTKEFVVKLGYKEDDDYLSIEQGDGVFHAPEVLEQNQKTCSADIWSIGCILFEIIFQQHALLTNGSKNFDRIKNLQCKLQFSDQQTKFKYLSALEQMLSLKAKNRPSINQILQDFFAQQQRQPLSVTQAATQLQITQQQSSNNLQQQNQLQVQNQVPAVKQLQKKYNQVPNAQISDDIQDISFLNSYIESRIEGSKFLKFTNKRTGASYMVEKVWIGESSLDSVNQQLQILLYQQSITHINLLRIHHIIRTENHIYVFRDVMDGQLSSLINSSSKTVLNHEHTLSILIQTCQAVQFLNSKNVIHNAISLESIFYYFDRRIDQYIIKLGAFSPDLEGYLESPAYS